MKILVFGKTGQVATELQRRASVIALGREVADLSQPRAAYDAAMRIKPDLIINAAAYTAVDKAETEEALASAINGAAPGEMARAASDMDVPFVHVSTDYVFDGTGQKPFSPDDPVAPLGAYGRSKLAGEQAVREAGGNWTVLRTSWVFSAHGGNFVKTMLRLGAQRAELNVVADQIGGPTGARDIADACLRIGAAMRDGVPGGIHHFSGAPDVSWAQFAREIFAQADLDVQVHDIGAADYPTPAKRPANSRLDCSQLEQVFGISRPDWRVALSQVLAELA